MQISYMAINLLMHQLRYAGGEQEIVILTIHRIHGSLKQIKPMIKGNAVVYICLQNSSWLMLEVIACESGYLMKSSITFSRCEIIKLLVRGV